MVAGIFLALLMIGSGTLAWLWIQPYRGYPESEKLVVIARGTSSLEVARMLEREGLVRHWSLFLTYLKTVKRNARLQAGEYRFDGPQPVTRIADKLIRGLIYYHEVTIPEGYSLFEIAELLEQKKLCSPGEFWKAAKRVDRVLPMAKASENLEGFLFPDTYWLALGTSADDIVGMMVARFGEIHARWLAAAAKDSPLSLEQLMTLASLIEKEAHVDAERELVSAVFHNRLKKRMPLQCDPTVIYAARLAGQYRGTIFQSDLNLDSPYNTYRRVGLPPGPIANPGRRSIEAALKPAQVDYLYFVADNRGGHVFSSTLQAHQRAVSAYRKGLGSATSKLTSSPAPLRKISLRRSVASLSGQSDG